ACARARKASRSRAERLIDAMDETIRSSHFTDRGARRNLRPMTQLLRIGCGAGFSGDRWDAAVPVVKTLRALGGPAVLMFETLAERTLALAQLKRRQDPDSGWEP